MNNLTLLIAQTLGFIGFIISLLAFHKKKKEKILGNMILSNIFDLIHYLLLGAYSGCVTKLLAIFRNSFVIFKDKYKALSSNIFLYYYMLYLEYGLSKIYGLYFLSYLLLFMLWLFGEVMN